MFVCFSPICSLQTRPPPRLARAAAHAPARCGHGRSGGSGAGNPIGISQPDRDLDLPAVLERLAEVSSRPRYTFMVLNLIARAAGSTDSAGPYVREGARRSRCVTGSAMR
jgi:hypothetical protein